jgi:carbohydrate-selective porin OprB
VRTGLHLMPDLQYVIHPAATHAVPDATVISLRIKLDL